MAYVPEKKDEKDQEGVASTPPGSFGDTTPTSTPTKSNFVNVGEYLGKNPDASGAIGEAAAGKLNQQRTEAEGALQDTQSKFGQAVQGGSSSLDQGFLDRAFSDPTAFASNSGDLAKFTALRDASYKGPSSLESTDSYAPTAAKINELGQTATSVGNEAGRNALVQGLSSHPTQGKTALSQLLLQGSDAAARKVSDAASGFKGVEDQWQQFLQAAPNQIAQAKTATDQARDATRAGLQQATSGFTNQLQNQLTKATGERNAYNTKVSNLDSTLANLSPSPSAPLALTQEQRDAIGVPSEDYFRRLGEARQILGRQYNQASAPLNTFLSGATPVSAMPTMGNTASSADYAKEAALQQMAGFDLGLNNDEAGQAGSYNPQFGKQSFDTEAANQVFGQLNTADKNVVDPLISQYFGLTDDSSDKYSTAASRELAYDQNLKATTGQSGVLGGTDFYAALNRLADGYGPLPTVSTPAGATDHNTQPTEDQIAAGPQYPDPTTPKPEGNWMWNPYTGKWQPFGNV